MAADTPSPADARAALWRSARHGVLAGLALATLLLAPTWHGMRRDAAAPAPLAAPALPARWADFGRHAASAETRAVADWIADSRNNQGAEFIILDKRAATLYVFDAHARVRNATPVLLGAAVGDDNVPGIGTRPIADVLPHERTTPAGRFVAERGRNLSGEDVVWVDYDAAVSMHRVRATDPRERRRQRLASATVADNRISYGCINVPADFFDAFVLPSVAGRTAIVYVMPETRAAQPVFGAYDVTARHGAGAARARGAS
ncbi:MAG TPA: hypothetical protein VFQ20_07455 [Burkholderiaceae bacterium]|nr:hypothetical protein [Burkholderiaceae bacterium]